MTIENINPYILNLCAVCVSETSGGQTALMIILLSFAFLGLASRSWKKYFKKKNKTSFN